MVVKVHELKSWPEYFEPVLTGKKTFELRKDDRHYKVGDILKLREWEPNTAKYSGREIRKRVVYFMDGIGPGAVTPMHGLLRQYCIMGIADE